MSDAAPNAEAEIARTLRIRNPSLPVTRLSRKVLIGGAALAATVIGGATWWALEGHRSGPKPDQELYSATSPNPPDNLAQLPHDYIRTTAEAVPRLGPPLPGDLGRPIVAAEGRASVLPGESDAALPSGTPSANPTAPDQVRRQAALTREAARTSRLFASMGEGAATAQVPEPAAAIALTASSATTPGSDAPAAATTPTDHKLAFLPGGKASPMINPARLTAPVSPYIVQAGNLISAALITGVASDLPGQVIAQVTEDVRDSVTGRWLLIPQGSRLIGTYDSQVGFGQSRVLLAWTRLILPNGKSIDLGRAPAADRAGYAGLHDGVDHHWRALFGAAALSTVLAVGSEAGSSNTDAGIVQALRRGSQDTLNRAGEEAVRRQLDVAPTLTIKPGHPVRVVVEHDLVLEPYETEADR